MTAERHRLELPQQSPANQEAFPRYRNPKTKLKTEVIIVDTHRSINPETTTLERVTSNQK